MSSQQLDQIEKILEEIKKDWKDTNKRLFNLVKTSTQAITRVDMYLERPFWKRYDFYTRVATVLAVIFVGSLAVVLTFKGDTCTKIDWIFEFERGCESLEKTNLKDDLVQE